MVIRKCDRCGKEFDRKSNFNFHINRKYKCSIINKIIGKKGNKLVDKNRVLQKSKKTPKNSLI